MTTDTLPLSAVDYFTARLRFETDVDDVARALASGDPGFAVIDVRSRSAYEAGRVPGALWFERPFDASALPDGELVVYCWGPGCNGATKAARELALLGRGVREMLGGFEYWVREGHPVEGFDSASLAAVADVNGLVRPRGSVSCLC